jgi:hypothetical protein
MSSEPGTCANCGHPLGGVYCSRCGEERLDPDKLTVWHFVTRSMPEEIFDLDGKIWRTLRLLLFRPGFLALEYAAGRRRRYVNPLRILLTAIVIYVLSTPSGLNFTLSLGKGFEDFRLSVVPVPVPKTRSVDASLDQIDRLGMLERMFNEKLGPPEEATDDVRNRFNDTLAGLGTPLSFTTVLLLAVPLYLCFSRRRPLFVEHAVFSMHYFSFVLLTAPLYVLGLKLGQTTGNMLVFVGFMLAATLWQFTYLAVAARRFYFPETRRLLAWPAAGALAVLLFVLNSFFMTAVQLAVGAIAILRL